MNIDKQERIIKNAKRTDRMELFKILFTIMGVLFLSIASYSFLQVNDRDFFAYTILIVMMAGHVIFMVVDIIRN